MDLYIVEFTLARVGVYIGSIGVITHIVVILWIGRSRSTPSVSSCVPTESVQPHLHAREDIPSIIDQSL